VAHASRRKHLTKGPDVLQRKLRVREREKSVNAITSLRYKSCCVICSDSPKNGNASIGNVERIGAGCTGPVEHRTVLVRVSGREANGKHFMFVILTKGYEELSRRSAAIVSAAIRNRPDLRMGLATGTTPLGTYRELARMHREEGLDFSRVITFNLDEYLGLAADHPQSAHTFMQSSFFDHVNVAPKNIHVPDGSAHGDLDEYCAKYEAAIQRAGGIDLQILGIGRNGHIGFNEPSSSLASRTRIKTLTRSTIEDNRRLFQESQSMPEAAITMGIGTILDARKILLLASGTSKARALARAIEGPITASVTASALQLHRDVTILADEAAAAELSEREYYRRDFEMDSRLRRAAKSFGHLDRHDKARKP